VFNAVREYSHVVGSKPKYLNEYTKRSMCRSLLLILCGPDQGYTEEINTQNINPDLFAYTLK